MEQKLGEPAFPRTYSHSGHNGMTLRDYFAAHVDIPWEVAAEIVYRRNGNQNGAPEDIMAKRADLRYAQADAMIKAHQGAANG